MRLNNDAKSIIMGNIELLKFCNKSCISIEKLKRCNIESMGKHYVFGLAKENMPESKSLIPLDIDLETQPDVVLVMTIKSDNEIEFETTEKTIRVLEA